ncbi:hypothetical protein HDF14_001065 [Edaphobacter lichenicola]|uniref:Uncharacterized protein n=1 Tax=Tunturiibacter gelidiferens TaxID=3069689 RepID=A0A9X0U316_9BACT|nr:hypothetical protein [Edaphobacter lichenicola]
MTSSPSIRVTRAFNGIGVVYADRFARRAMISYR